MSESNDNRRTHERKQIELKVEYKRLNTFFADYTRNISKGGTFIRTRNPLPLGTRFLFRLHVPGLAQPLELDGRVKWTVAEGEEKPGIEPGMGIEFVYESGDSAKTVQVIVEDLLKSSFGAHVATQLQPTGKTEDK